MPHLPYISPDLIKTYQDEISKSSSPATAKRKVHFLKRFFDWAEGEGHIAQNPFVQVSDKKSEVVSVTPTKKTGAKRKTWAVVGLTGASVVVLFLLAWKLKFPIQFINNFAKENTTQTVQNTNQNSNTITAVPAANPIWNLYARLKLTDTDGQPKSVLKL